MDFAYDNPDRIETQDGQLMRWRRKPDRLHLTMWQDGVQFGTEPMLS